MKENKTSNNYIYVILAFTTIFWAGAFIAGKFSLEEIPAFSVAFFRFLFASIIIAPIMIYREKNKSLLKLNDLYTVVFLGFIGMFGYHTLFFTALKYTSSINSSLIASTNPIWVNILSVAILGSKIGYKKAGAICLSFIGVILTISNGDISIFFRSGLNKGDFFMMIGIFCWAIYTVLSKKVMNRYSPLIITTYSFITATVLLFPFFLSDYSKGYLNNITYKGWISVLYMAIFPSVIGYLVWQIGIQKIGAAKTSLFANLVPIFSIILSIIFLNESFSLFKFFTSVLIIVGVFLNTINKDKEFKTTG